jgi:hypothetical protein
MGDRDRPLASVRGVDSFILRSTALGIWLPLVMPLLLPFQHQRSTARQPHEKASDCFSYARILTPLRPAAADGRDWRSKLESLRCGTVSTSCRPSATGWISHTPFLYRSPTPNLTRTTFMVSYPSFYSAMIRRFRCDGQFTRTL